MMQNFEKQLAAYGKLVEERLEDYMERLDCGDTVVREAMRYSLMNGGKRIRPVLTLAFCEALGGAIQQALPFACAVEMLHTYSLIHDDLPCMDDDEMRRGKPSCHVAYGERYALLAGDALLNLAFETALGRFGDVELPAEQQLQAARYFSMCTGVNGMIGGQTLDLLNESREDNLTLDDICDVHRMKTGALIRSACAMGCIAAGTDSETLQKAETYAECIGLAFQIVDDILDETGTAEELGKPVGGDAKCHKTTYVTLLGTEKSHSLADELTMQALESLGSLGDQGWFLLRLAEKLAHRTK